MNEAKPEARHDLDHYELLGICPQDLLQLSNEEIPRFLRAKALDIKIAMPTPKTIEELGRNIEFEKRLDRIVIFLSDPLERTRYNCTVVNAESRTKNVPTSARRLPEMHRKVVPGVACEDLDELEIMANRIIINRHGSKPIPPSVSNVDIGAVVDQVRSNVEGIRNAVLSFLEGR